jgi:glucosamine-6-phosphate deaminase
MIDENVAVERLKVGTVKLEVYPSRQALGAAAARAAAHAMRELNAKDNDIAIIFATGASQLDTLEALTTIENLPWNKVLGFHLDEYLGIDPNHPASFRHYLREKLAHKVPMKAFFEIDGSTTDPEKTCQEYADKLASAHPQLCLLGIGENGHLAFNDPPVADFNDPLAIKVVQLDTACKEQQVAEGWFETYQSVPEKAITLTIPTLFRVPKLIVSVPGSRKAQIIRRTLEESISTACPSTFLRTHPDATIYLDPDSAAELDGFEFVNAQ